MQGTKNQAKLMTVHFFLLIEILWSILRTNYLFMRILLAFTILLFSFNSFSQNNCGKRFKLVVDKVISVNADGSDGESVPLTAKITISKDSIHVILHTDEGDDIDVNGVHTETVCKMNSDYTDGTIDWKTKAVLITPDGQTRDSEMIFNLVAKNGVLKLYGVPTESPTEKLCFIIKEKQEAN